MQILALVASLFMVVDPSAAAARTATSTTPSITITASGATNVGLQIFANVNLTGGSAPSGSITFRLFAPGDTTCVSTIFTSTVPVSGTSMNSARYTTAAAGTYRFTAVYNGDTNNNPAGPTSCAAPSASVVVQGATAVISVTAPAPAGGTIHGAASLGGGFNPTGTISFFLYGPGDTFCSQIIFTSPATVQGNGPYASGAYAPTVAGTYRWRASYTGDANNTGSPMTSCLDQNDSVNVTTVSQPPAVALNPTSLTFAAQQVGATGPAQTLTVTNTGGTNLTISSVARTGAAATDFATSADHCTGATIAPSTSCTVTVAFSPTAAGTRTAALNITDNASGSPHSAALSGQATAAPDRALLTYPLDGQSAVDTTRAFTWSPIPQGQAYYLAVGTALYGTDLVNSGVLPPGQTAFNGPALPTGRTLYATVLTEINGAWARYQAITFTAAPGLATFVSPANGQTKVGKTALFSWAPIAQGQAYYLVVGTTLYATNVVNSGILPAAQTSYSGASLPAGTTLYATLLTQTNGSWTRYQTIVFSTT